MQQEDLGELGVDVATPQPSPVRVADRLHQVLPLNGRAAELMEAIAYRNDDRGLLEALLADGSGRLRRLLDHLDVDVDVRGLIGQEPFLSQSERREPRAAPIPPPEGLVWMTASSGQVVPVSPERVWALMRDVARRTEWDVTCSGVTTDADGDQLVTRTGGDAVTDTIVGIVPGREITWRVRYPGRACPRSCRSS